MPTGAPRPCTQPGCKALVTKGSRCALHPYKMQRSKAAKEYNKLYNTARWRKRRKAHLNQYPLCVDCEGRDMVVPARVVDHKIPHKGDVDLFFNESNWQSLCDKCHNRKTARRDGGFNR